MLKLRNEMEKKENIKKRASEVHGIMARIENPNYLSKWSKISLIDNLSGHSQTFSDTNLDGLLCFY